MLFKIIGIMLIPLHLAIALIIGLLRLTFKTIKIVINITFTLIKALFFGAIALLFVLIPKPK